MVKGKRDQPFGADDHQGDKSQALGQNDEGRFRNLAHSAWQEGDGQHQGNYSDILEDENAQDGPALGGVHLGFFLDYPQHNGRAAHGDQKSDQDSRTDRLAKVDQQGIDSEDGQGDLKGAPNQDILFHLHQIFQGDLQPDGEEQQDDADLRQDINLLDGLNQTQALGAGQRPGEYEAHDCRCPDLMEYEEY
ncbi:MAG: hypothetical protein A4E43_00830 [Methanosaeta sp. PtaB.Bin005]|nr:MAG: hypothetical protein A4E43_00830 [Methanosaeta sp. PtaB.Bin005]